MLGVYPTRERRVFTGCAKMYARRWALDEHRFQATGQYANSAKPPCHRHAKYYARKASARGYSPYRLRSISNNAPPP
jgi:hypothetical protein